MAIYVSSLLYYFFRISGEYMSLVYFKYLCKKLKIQILIFEKIGKGMYLNVLHYYYCMYFSVCYCFKYFMYFSFSGNFGNILLRVTERL